MLEEHETASSPIANILSSRVAKRAMGSPFQGAIPPGEVRRSQTSRPFAAIGPDCSVPKVTPLTGS
jgi:hypothetical protein